MSNSKKDHEEIYDREINFTTGLFGLIFSLVIGWLASKVRKVEVKAAFLNSDINREIYIRNPSNLSHSSIQ